MTGPGRKHAGIPARSPAGTSGGDRDIPGHRLGDGETPCTVHPHAGQECGGLSDAGSSERGEGSRRRIRYLNGGKLSRSESYCRNAQYIRGTLKSRLGRAPIDCRESSNQIVRQYISNRRCNVSLGGTRPESHTDHQCDVRNRSPPTLRHLSPTHTSARVAAYSTAEVMNRVIAAGFPAGWVCRYEACTR